MGRQHDWTERQLGEGQERSRELKVTFSQLQQEVRESHDAHLELREMAIRHQDAF